MPAPVSEASLVVTCLVSYLVWTLFLGYNQPMPLSLILGYVPYICHYIILYFQFPHEFATRNDVRKRIRAFNFSRIWAILLDLQFKGLTTLFTIVPSKLQWILAFLLTKDLNQIMLNIILKWHFSILEIMLNIRIPWQRYFYFHISRTVWIILDIWLECPLQSSTGLKWKSFQMEAKSKKNSTHTKYVSIGLMKLASMLLLRSKIGLGTWNEAGTFLLMFFFSRFGGR